MGQQLEITVLLDDMSEMEFQELKTQLLDKPIAVQVRTDPDVLSDPGEHIGFGKIYAVRRYADTW